MRIGIMTGGGDAPGLNGIIEAVGRTLIRHGHATVGIKNGFEGVFEGRLLELNLEKITGLHSQAGTCLGTSNRCGVENREEEFYQKYKKLKLDGLIVAGGDGTFRGLQRVQELYPDFKLIGVPKTIDNDLPGTEITFGYDTACSVVAESVDALWHTAEAHQRVFVVEVMGRNAGWIALGGGLSSYADVILLPEIPYRLKDLKNHIEGIRQGGRHSMMIVAAEGAQEEGGSQHVAFQSQQGGPQPTKLGGIAQWLARWIENTIDWEARHIVLGHLQRSRAPTTTDRFLTVGMGVQAASLALQGQWGKAVVYREGRIQPAEISEIMGSERVITLDHRWLKLAHQVGIFTGQKV